MSLRPVTKSRRRQWRRSSLHGQKKWSSNWTWNDVRRFEPSKHKRGLLALFLFFLVLVAAGMYADPNNALFHSATAGTCHSQNLGAPCDDPSQIIWQAPDRGSLSDFSTYAGSGAVIYKTPCDNIAGTSCIEMVPTSTQSVEALSVGTVGELSAASKALLEFHITWQIQGTLNLVLNQGPSFRWGYYLTTNNTLPLNSRFKNTNPWYDPMFDKSANFVQTFWCDSACNTLQPVIGSSTYLLRTLGFNDTNFSEQTNYQCSQAGSPFFCNNLITTYSANNNKVFDSEELLNYTGVVNGGTCTVNTIGGQPGVLVAPSPGCSWSLNFPVTSPNPNGLYWQSSQTLPWFALQSQQYHIGFFASGNATNFNIINGGAIEFTFNGGTSGNNQIFTFSPNTTGPTIDTGGFFGPVIRALIGIGVFIFNSILGFIAFIAPALQAALNFLETQIINILNLIGNALGFGNVGTDLSTFLNNMITFFTNNTYGLPAFFGFFGTYFTNFLRWLQIDFNFIGPIFTIANAILIFGVNGILEGITIFTIGLQMLLFGYGTFIVFSYFIYVGDDGIGGLFTFLGTLEAISFKILNSIVIVTNLGLDFLIMMISLIPKPFIQMTATRIPRLPTIESEATMSFPTLDFGEARNGNLIVYWLWCMGLWFVAWFESQNPSLPGSIGMLDPAVAVNVRQLSAYIPLLQAVTLISGGLVVIWFSMLPLRLAGIDVTEAPIGASLGRRAGPGPSSIHISGGKKHLIGPAKKAEQLRQAEKGSKGSKVKKEEKAKEAIEKRRKEIEEKRRSEELRKKELARKPTGKDLRGPNL